VTTASIGCPLCGSYDHTEAECDDPAVIRARMLKLAEEIAASEVWCPCYDTPEPKGPWVLPDDWHADVHWPPEPQP
jgi:hypothetical protein